MAKTNHAHSLPDPQEDPAKEQMFSKKEIDEFLDLEKKGIVVTDNPEEIELTEADIQVEETHDKVQQKVFAPHLTDGVPDEEFRKKLHESKIMPEGFLYYSGDEEGNIEGAIGDHKFYGLTENGIQDRTKARKKVNDDAFFIDPKSKSIIVTDGVGSAKTGFVASNIAIHRAAKDLNESALKGMPPCNLDTLLSNMNDSVDECQDNNPSLKNTSATVVAARIKDDNSVDIAYAGDSKAILIRGDKVVFSTVEDNVLNYFMKKLNKTESELKDKLKKDDEDNEIKIHDYTYWKYKSAVIQCLGHEANAIDWETGETSRKINSHLQNVQAENGDVLILCSDGLSDNLTAEQIALSVNKSLQSGKSINEAIEHLKEEVLYKMKNDRKEGKGDNLTIVGVQI